MTVTYSKPEDPAETAAWERSKAAGRRPPAADSFEDQQAAELANFKERWSAVQSSLVLPQVPPTSPPVGVRESDVLIIGGLDGLSVDASAHMADTLRSMLGFHVKVVFVGGSGVTVLRPERDA